MTCETCDQLRQALERTQAERDALKHKAEVALLTVEHAESARLACEQDNAALRERIKTLQDRCEGYSLTVPNVGSFNVCHKYDARRIQNLADAYNALREQVKELAGALKEHHDWHLHQGDARFNRVRERAVKIMIGLTKEEAARIAWLTEYNTKRLGAQYKKAARDIAIAQVAMERTDNAERSKGFNNEGDRIGGDDCVSLDGAIPAGRKPGAT